MDKNLKPRPYESGSAVAEYNEAVTGDSAEAFGVTTTVPVTVTDPVTVAPEPARAFITGTTVLTAAPQRVANDVPTRRRCVLTVTGGVAGDSATLARGQALCGPSTGFSILTGQSLTIEAAGELWIADLAGAGLSVSVYAEFADGS